MPDGIESRLCRVSPLAGFERLRDAQVGGWPYPAHPFAALCGFRAWPTPLPLGLHPLGSALAAQQRRPLACPYLNRQSRVGPLREPPPCQQPSSPCPRPMAGGVPVGAGPAGLQRCALNSVARHRHGCNSPAAGQLGRVSFRAGGTTGASLSAAIEWPGCSWPLKPEIAHYRLVHNIEKVADVASRPSWDTACRLGHRHSPEIDQNGPIRTSPNFDLAAMTSASTWMVSSPGAARASGALTQLRQAIPKCHSGESSSSFLA